jgi:hypothetical protein
MWRFNLALQSMSSATAAINAGDYVLLNCGASVPGAIRDEMAFTSACAPEMNCR